MKLPFHIISASGYSCMNTQLKDNLVCPRDKSRLVELGNQLCCEFNHSYPVIDGIPVLLVNEVPQTLWVGSASLDQSRITSCVDPYRIATLGISDEEEAELNQRILTPMDSIDPVVSFLVAATNGLAYRHLVGKLRGYPIPDLRLPEGNGEVLLDIGCSWGRWSLAAAQKGYSVIGLDPSLGAVLAARRVAYSLGLSTSFIVADARFLPFRAGFADIAFSYSVLQHFSRSDAERAIAEIGRTLRPRGRALVQMPTVLGVRCLYHQARRGFRQPRAFDVRYWTIPALRRLFTQRIGDTSIKVDCYFGIGLQLRLGANLPGFDKRLQAIETLADALTEPAGTGPRDVGLE